MPWFFFQNRISDRFPGGKSHASGRFIVRGFTALVFAAFLSGCHSANVNATVTNRSSTSISLIQVEYPSASFGTQTLAPNQDFKYRFKILGSGQIKMMFTDSRNAEHKSVGPSLTEGSEGTISIVVTDTGVDWLPALTSK